MCIVYRYWGMSLPPWMMFCFVIYTACSSKESLLSSEIYIYDIEIAWTIGAKHAKYDIFRCSNAKYNIGGMLSQCYIWHC